MNIEFNTRLCLRSGQIQINLPFDFYHNCLTKDPYPHSHPKYELHYILQGECCVELADERLNCSQGQFLILPPHTVHRLLPKMEQTVTMTLTYSLEHPEPNSAIHAIACEAPKIVDDSFDALRHLLEIRREMSCRQRAYAEKIQGLLILVVAELARTLSQGNEVQNKPLEENRAEHIEAYLTNHRYDSECSCEGLAREMNLSQRQVHRLCLRYYNAPFRQLLTNTRMNIAAHRLRTTDISVHELALELGYASSASFSAAYKRHFGHAPSDERHLENRT